MLQSGRQGGRVAIIGMMYPRLTTSSEAVARLALTPLKWRGLLENCVSFGQVCYQCDAWLSVDGMFNDDAALQQSCICWTGLVAVKKQTLHLKAADPPLGTASHLTLQAKRCCDVCRWRWRFGSWRTA